MVSFSGSTYIFKNVTFLNKTKGSTNLDGSQDFSINLTHFPWHESNNATRL